MDPPEDNVRDISRRFKPVRNFKKLCLENTQASATDLEVVVLVSMQTLLSPMDTDKLSPKRNGHPPCEGYAIVCKPDDPEHPIFEIGWIYLVEHFHISKKKEAVENLRYRVSYCHDIDPDRRDVYSKCCSARHGREEQQAFIVTRSLDEFLALVGQPLLEAVYKLKQELGAPVVFFTANDDTELKSARMSLQWLLAQERQTKPFKSTLDKLVNKIPSSADFPGTERPDPYNRGHRCPWHPPTKLAEARKNTDASIFPCCKLTAKRLWFSLCDVAASCVEKDDDASTAALIVADAVSGGGDGDGAAAALPLTDDQIAERTFLQILRLIQRLA